MGSPPKHVVVLAHPSPDSFNSLIAETYCETVRSYRQDVVLRDLYRLSFDPVLKADEQAGKKPHRLYQDVADELEVLQGVSTLVFVYPIWFGGPPAILKGYVERVIGSGFSYRAMMSGQSPAIVNDASLLSLTTSGTTLSWLEERGTLESLRYVFDKYLGRIFTLKSAQHVHFDAIVPGLSQQAIDTRLADVSAHARKICADMLMASYH